MYQQIEHLLQEVGFKIGTLEEARKRFSEQLAPDFRIFDFMRSDEMGLSSCLASLLDPKGKHGQGGVFLEIFLQQLAQLIPSTTTWASTSEIVRVCTEEQANGQRRIDIHLEFKHGAIGVENKPWAGDQKNQLIDYAGHLSIITKNEQWLLIYICNHEPGTESIILDEQRKLSDAGRFVRLNYTEIIDWLELCSCKSKAAVVRVFIEELVKFIRFNVNGELDMVDEHEVSDVIIKSTINLDSAFRIAKSMRHVKQELLKKLRADLKVKLESNDLWLDWNLEGWRAYIGFSINFTDHPQSLSLGFYFEKAEMNGFFWGISRNNKKYHNTAIWNEVNSLMNAQFFTGKSSEHWPWYAEPPRNEFEIEMEDWQLSPMPWLEISSGQLANKIADLAMRVRHAFQENNQLHLLLNEGGDNAS